MQSSVLRTTGVRFIFIENICTDPDILRNNYLNKMRYSPDYKDVCMEQVRRRWGQRWGRGSRAPAVRAQACKSAPAPPERVRSLGRLLTGAHACRARCGWLLQALSDFADRIKRYEEVYEPISDRSMHYIKLTDM